MLVTQSCPTLCDPMGYSPPGSSLDGDSPGQNTGVPSHSLLQEIFPSQALKPGLLHCRWILYRLSHRGSPDPWGMLMSNGNVLCSSAFVWFQRWIQKQTSSLQLSSPVNNSSFPSESEDGLQKSFPLPLLMKHRLLLPSFSSGQETDSQCPSKLGLTSASSRALEKLSGPVPISLTHHMGCTHLRRGRPLGQTDSDKGSRERRPGPQAEPSASAGADSSLG